jgi:hypothetical protein
MEDLVFAKTTNGIFCMQCHVAQSSSNESLNAPQEHPATEKKTPIPLEAAPKAPSPADLKPGQPPVYSSVSSPLESPGFRPEESRASSRLDKDALIQNLKRELTASRDSNVEMEENLSKLKVCPVC